jgi:hypothetical protein
MALTPQERKKLLSHGGLTRVARRARRSPSHVTRVNDGTRRDEHTERWIVRLLCERHPELDPSDVFPPMPAIAKSA